MTPSDESAGTTAGAAAESISKYSGRQSTSSSPPLQDVCLDLQKRVTAFLAEEPPTELLRDVQSRTRVSLAIVEESLDRYALPSISLSYNGGKDCLVLLILYLAALASPHRKHTDLPPALQSVYIVSRHPFPQVDDFVAQSSHQYGLDLVRLAGLGMRDAFEQYLKERPGIRAIMVGTRRTDPHGGRLGAFDPTDHGWPAFMRVHPVIDWHYREIWAFIRHLKIPYCELYDQGYTSLGGTDDTFPNPALKVEGDAVEDGTGEAQTFRPAYELWEDEEERLGRDR